jgi:hypothetical protein
LPFCWFDGLYLRKIQEDVLYTPKEPPTLYGASTRAMTIPQLSKTEKGEEMVPG